MLRTGVPSWSGCANEHSPVGEMIFNMLENCPVLQDFDAQEELLIRCFHLLTWWDD